MSLKLKHKALISLAVIAIILIPVIVSFAENANYIYDGNNRLIRVEYGDGRVVEYIYDEVGNLLHCLYQIQATITPVPVMSQMLRP